MPVLSDKYKKSLDEIHRGFKHPYDKNPFEARFVFI